VAADNAAALPQAYLAPYVACAIAEHFWMSGHDTIVIYDDLTSHAKIYRELSLLAGVSPGRDSYPGDIFYAHSSLLERAGKLGESGATQTAFPVILTPNDDITAFLPTNIMSITDGQLIFDMESFRRGIRPAINIGLSVSRVGSKVQEGPYRDLGKTVFKKIADYRRAESFSHFGSEIALQTKADLELGKLLYEAFRQGPTVSFTLPQQRLILETILKAAGQGRLNVDLLKLQVQQLSSELLTQENLAAQVEQLLTTCLESTAPAAKEVKA
jgi:F-type H+-transporting ATPase subunit alpha